MADLGLNDHHHQQAVNFIRFCRYKRNQRLKAIDHCFDDVKDSRLLEDETYTFDEVTEMLSGLLVVVKDEMESEILNSNHMSVLLMKQMLNQAEKWHLKLNADIAQLENKELLEQIAAFEKQEMSSGPGVESKFGKARLEPLNESGGAALLQMEIERLKEENARVMERAKTMESKVTSCLSENAQLKSQVAELKGKQKTTMDHSAVDDLESQMSNLRSELDANISQGQTKANNLTQDLTTTKHELLKVKEQLDLTEKELDRKFKETAAYRNLKDMLTKKNNQIKELRQNLNKYESSK